jgi:hypothetical protein
MQLLSLVIFERRATSSHRINSWSIPLQHSDNLACLLLQRKAEHATVVKKRRARENGLSSSLPHYDDDDDYKNHTESPPALDCQIVPRRNASSRDSHESVNREVHTNKPSTSLQRNEQRYYCCSLFSRKTLCFLLQLDVLSFLVALRNPGTGVRERERERERESRKWTREEETFTKGECVMCTCLQAWCTHNKGLCFVLSQLLLSFYALLLCVGVSTTKLFRKILNPHERFFI